MISRDVHIVFLVTSMSCRICMTCSSVLSFAFDAMISQPCSAIVYCVGPYDIDSFLGVTGFLGLTVVFCIELVLLTGTDRLFLDQIICWTGTDRPGPDHP